jgi:hypothetical protein
MEDPAHRESDIVRARMLLSQLTDVGWWLFKSERARAAGKQLCDLYLAADERTKDAIRQLNIGRSKQEDLLRFARFCASCITKRNRSEAIINTRRALAAASIEDLGLDWRSTQSALWKVYKAAIRAHINAQEYFREAAEFSSTQRLNTSMSVFLNDLREQFLRKIGSGTW